MLFLGSLAFSERDGLEFKMCPFVFVNLYAMSFQ
jgi:hypothetical protein